MKTITTLLAALTALYMVSGAASAADMNTGYYGAKKTTHTVTTQSGQACEVQNIEGKITSITPPNPAATDKRTIIEVVGNKGERNTFAVTPATTLYGADMNPIIFNAIKEGAAVKIKGFCAKEGEGVATSIILVK